MGNFPSDFGDFLLTKHTHRGSGRTITDLGLLRIVIHGIADHIFSVVLEGHHEVGKHPVYLPAPGIITFVARNEKYFRSSVVMADHPFAVIPED